MAGHKIRELPDPHMQKLIEQSIIEVTDPKLTLDYYIAQDIPVSEALTIIARVKEFARIIKKHKLQNNDKYSDELLYIQNLEDIRNNTVPKRLKATKLSTKLKNMIRDSYLNIKCEKKVAEIYKLSPRIVVDIIKSDNYTAMQYETEVMTKENQVLSMIDENFDKMKNVFSTYLDKANDESRIDHTNLRDLMKVWDVVADKIYSVENLKNARQRLEIEKMKIELQAEKLKIERDKLAILEAAKDKFDPLDDLKQSLMNLAGIDVDYTEVDTCNFNTTIEVGNDIITMDELTGDILNDKDGD